jgi:hypothetical protein
LARKKAQGALLGNRTNLTKAHEANRATAEAFAANALPVVRQIQAAGVSGLKNIANALNDRGVCAHRARRCMAQQHGAQPAGTGVTYLRRIKLSSRAQSGHGLSRVRRGGSASAGPPVSVKQVVARNS